MALAIAALHLVVPWALRGVVTFDWPRRFALVARRQIDAVYGGVTITLGVLAFVLSGHGYPDWARDWPAVWLGAGFAAGAGFPLLMALLVGRPRRFSRVPARLVPLLLCATAEEVLWRLVAFGALVHSGLPGWLAGAVSLAGFGLLHVPRSGWRALPYQLVFGVLLTLLAAWGGVLAAVLSHCAHNVVLTSTTRSRRGKVVATPVTLPSSQSWLT